MRRVAVVGIPALLLAGGGVGTWYLVATPNRDGEDGALVQTGQRIYADNCAACHGTRGEGQRDWRIRKPDGKLPAPPLNGDGHTWHHPDAQLRAIVAQGVEALAPAGYESDMPGFDDRLSDREIRAVLAYVRTWWPSDKLQRQQARSGGGG